MLLFLLLLFGPASSDTCGQDRVVLGDWFIAHGSPTLLEEPIPSLVSSVTVDPYLDPSNPPASQDVYCAMQWSSNTTSSGLHKYHLRNFETEAAAGAANFSITHKGHCASCSTLQDLGVYVRQNLTSATRSCAMKGILSKKLQHNCLLKLVNHDKTMTTMTP